MAYAKVLVGYDGSENAKRALEKAIAVSKSEGASLKVVVVVNSILPGYGSTAPYYPPGYPEKVMQEGKEVLDRALQQAKGAGKEATGSVVDGHPADVILRTSETEGVDLVVLGRRGVSGMERFLIGGVSSSVVGHSKCDVLVVK